MTKQDLIKNVSLATDIDDIEVRIITEAIMKVVIEKISKGETLYLRRFGTFAPTKRARKPARNISTGEVVIIPERFVPTFKPCKEFVEMMSRGK